MKRARRERKKVKREEKLNEEKNWSGTGEESAGGREDKRGR